MKVVESGGGKGINFSYRSLFLAGERIANVLSLENRSKLL